MSDTHALPKGLAAALQHSLLPKLSTAGLQACAQTCSELRQAVLEAPWSVWRSAWDRASMPRNAFTRTPDPCSSMSRLARQHALVRAGPTGVRTIQGSISGLHQLEPSFTALQPDFAQLASLCDREVILTPMNRRDAAGYAKCPSGIRSTMAKFQSLWDAESNSSPDGRFLVALSNSGFSLYACQPTLRLVNKVRLVGERRVVDWAPNSQQFSFLTISEVYVFDVPGLAGRAVEIRPVAQLVACLWSPCSKYIAVTARLDDQGSRCLHIACASQGTVLSTGARLRGRHEALGWVHLKDEPSLAFNTSAMGPLPSSVDTIWLQDVGGSEPWGGFSAPESWLHIGYSVAGGHRVADVNSMVLYDFTAEGLGCPVTLASAGRPFAGLATWGPSNSIWLAMLGMGLEVMTSYHVVEGVKVRNRVYSVYLQVIDGRSGRPASFVMVLETSFELQVERLAWSGSGSGLLVGLKLTADASRDCRPMWMKNYYRFK